MIRDSFKKWNIFIFTGVVIFILIAILIAILLAILLHAKNLDFMAIIKEDYIRSVIFFTIFQASLSTLLVISFAIPIARALHRRSNFFGRGILIKITNLSFILPAIVLTLGIAVVHGKNGWVNKFLSLYNISFNYYLYGLFGILVGHLAYSLPLAIRVFLSKLESIPPDNWRLASQLGFNSRKIIKLIEFPILLPSIAGVSILIFMMCFTSFVIALSLGGGPQFATIEVAIFQALRFDFDIERAVALSLIQFCVCFFLMLFVSKFIYHSLFVQTKNRSYIRPDLDNIFGKICDLFFIFCLILLVVLPLISVVISGLNYRFFFVVYTREFWLAFGYSLYIAIFSGILSLIFAPALLLVSFYLNYYKNKNVLGTKVAMIANFSMVMPPFIFITGLFIIVRPFFDVFDIAVYLTILVNAIMALPFVVGILYQSVTSFTKEELWLSKSLNLEGWNFFKLVCWHRIRKSVGYAFALSVAISWGDLSVVTLIGNKNFMTLPSLLYHNISNYRVSDAAVIAFILLFISYILFWAIEEFVGGEEDVTI